MAIGSPQWMYKSGEAYELEQSLKFNDDDSAYLSWTPASAGNRKTWTYSAWVKVGNLGTQRSFLSTTGSTYTDLRVSSNNKLVFYIDDGSSYSLYTTQLFRDPSAWYNIVVIFDTTQATASNRVKIYVNGGQITSFSTSNYPAQNYDGTINNNIVHSIGRREQGGGHPYDGYLAEVNFIDGQALTPADFGETGTYGEWKPIEYSGTYGTNGFYLPFKNDYTVEGFSTVIYKGNATNQYIGGVGFSPDLVIGKSRDTASTPHEVIDTVRGTSKRLQTNSTGADTTANNDGFVSTSNDGFLLDGTGGGGNFNGSGRQYVAWNWDMGADTPTGFSVVTSKGNATARSIGNVGFSPDLVWNKTLSANQNHFVYDRIRGANKELRTNQGSAEGTNDGVESFDPDGFSRGSSNDCNENNITYVDWCWDMGGTSATNTSGSITSTVMANPTYGQSIVTWTGNATANASVGHGLSSAPDWIMIKNRSTGSTQWRIHDSTSGKRYVFETGAGSTGYTVSFSSTTFSFDSDSGTHTDWNGNGNEMVAYCFHDVSNYSKFGSYTGNGSSTGPSVTLGFRPAFLMVKISTDTGGWEIWDSTRNPLNPLTNTVQANLSNAELTSGRDIEFTDTGFQIKNTTSNSNGSGETYIYMAFAGGMDSISDYNTTGQLDSRVKANSTYGQSVVSYTGNGSGSASIGHGLSSAPEVMIIKNRDEAAGSDWIMYHSAIGNTKHLRMNLNSSEYTSGTRWSNTTPTSSVFTVGSDSSVNENDDKFIAYCFHSVTGYSKFGSYSGSGSAGKVITTGFAPAFVVIKASTAANDWFMYDNTRKPTNPNDLELYANNSNAEYASGRNVNFTSTGFELDTANFVNNSSTTYIYMAFADKREYAYWLDQSGNNNDWTSNNLTESDISVDSPTNNFATFNPIARRRDVTTTPTFSEGNLKATFPDAGGNTTYAVGTIPSKSGKHYYELLVNNYSTNVMIAIGTQNDLDGASNTLVNYQLNDGTIRKYNTVIVNASTCSSGDIVGCAYDLDNGTVKFYKNGTLQGTVTGITDYHYFPFTRGSTSDVTTVNFGQDSSFGGAKTAQGNQDSNEIGDFYYTPPTGFLALCTKNLPDVAVVPSENFDVVTYTGTGSNQAVAVNFQPDFSWIKIRSDADGSVVADSVRGATKFLSTTYTQAENTNSAFVSAFTSTGLTLGGNRGTSESGRTYVAWNWKANGSGSSNSNGSITSTVSANVDSGFSIINWTKSGSSGTKTVGHGLSKAPEIIIFKEVDDPSNWSVWNSVTGYPTKSVLYLDLTAAEANSDANQWSNTAPTSTVFTYNQSYSFGGNNTAEMIGYAFHSVDGYSKVGSFSGNSNDDGTFVYTGFRPAWVMVKRTENSDNWLIWDAKRNTYNVMNTVLKANDAAADSSDNAYRIDFTSNGFKLRDDFSGINTSETYIYLAFAETPFKYSNAR